MLGMVDGNALKSDVLVRSETTGASDTVPKTAH